MTGPFYTGISCVLEMPSFSLRLCSPSSTSVHLEVALKFGGEEGLILQLITEGMLAGTSSFLKGLDCSRISKYKEEDERYCIYMLVFMYFVVILLFVLIGNK